MSLNRFLIRGFPDPVTEGLSFAKNLMATLQDTGLIKIVCSFGNPPLKTFSHFDLKKLLENPSSLNLRHALSGPNSGEGAHQSDSECPTYPAAPTGLRCTRQ
jgi:hypothetical protein